MDQINYQMVIDYAQTPIQGTNLKVWHVGLFLVIGPMVTWPMLVLIVLVLVKYTNISGWGGKGKVTVEVN